MGRTRAVPLSTMCVRALSAAPAAPRTRQVSRLLYHSCAAPCRTDGHFAWARHGMLRSLCSKWGKLLACTDKVMQSVMVGTPLGLGLAWRVWLFVQQMERVARL